MSPGAEDDRERSLALLRAQHQFPGAYDLSVIAVSTAAVAAAVRAAVEDGLAEPLGRDAHQVIPSTGGKYASHRFVVYLRAAEDVLALYDRVKQVTGVVTIL